MADQSRYPQTMPIELPTPASGAHRKAVPRNRLVLGAALVTAAIGASSASALTVTYDGIAADGHLALFSTAEKMVPGDTDNEQDVFVRSKDATLGEYVTREVSIGPPLGGNDAQPAQYDGVSESGEEVFFSTKEQLVAADKDSQEDIYMRNLETNATTLVSQADSSCPSEGCGGPASGAGFVPRGVVPSGERVFFATTERLSAEDTDNELDVYMRDLSGGGRTVLISQGDSSCAGSNCGNGEAEAFFKRASNDGEAVFFTSTEGLVLGDNDGRVDIYERDLKTETGSTVLVSAPGTCPAGLPAGQNCDPNFRGASNDGSHVFFESNEQISGADTDTSQDVYDWSGSGPAALVSTGPSGGNGTPNATYAGTSSDGVSVYFETSERVDPVADTDETRDVYARSGGTATILVSTGPESRNGPAPASFEWASPDGSTGAVIFSTTEALTGADTDTVQDVYERSGSETTLLSTGPESRNGPASASFAGASNDGSRVFFITAEALLVEDEDTSADIYLRSAGETALVSTGSIGGNGSYSAGLHGVSADGSVAFFVTQERLATDDDFLSEDDVYSWTAPKSPGSSAKTLLVSVKNAAELVLGPPPPLLEGTLPAGSGESTEPRIVGQAEAGAEITIYTSSSCSGKAVPPGGTAEELAGAGIPVTVGEGSTTTFYATAEKGGIVSPCSNGVTYTQQTAPPPSEEQPPGGGGTGGGTGGGGNTSGGSGSGNANTGHGFTYVAPETLITFGPAAKTRKRKVVFRFSDATDQPGSSFECKLDRRRWRACSSPKRLAKLARGRHVFSVKAVNALGAPDAQPAKRSFKVVR